MGKCGGPFKIHKKKVFALLRVITKVFLLCDTNASKMGKKLCVQCRKKIMQMPVEMPVEQSSPQHKHWPTGPAHFSDRRTSTGQYIVYFTGPAGPPS